MFLKNYTSDVPVSDSIRRIEQVLIQCGVTAIQKEYGPTGKVAAITFRVTENGRHHMIRLPSDEEAATDALWRNYMGDDLLPDGKIKWSCRKKLKKKDFEKQGERTAWRIAKDWIEIEMSRIQLGQGEVMQVFLSYAWNDQLKQTFYHGLKDKGFLALKDAT